ncbi:hypothetical protein ACH4EC_37415 [Streptomyces anulatus]
MREQAATNFSPSSTIRPAISWGMTGLASMTVVRQLLVRRPSPRAWGWSPAPGGGSSTRRPRSSTSKPRRTSHRPYPGLVTLEATENGGLLLADLLHTGALLLDGTADDVLAVGTAMALEAGTCGWTDHTEIMTVGLGTRLATLLPRGRVRPLPYVSAVVADLGALLLEVHQQTGNTDMPEPLPWILVCAGEVDAEQAWQLADAVSATRDLPIAIVLPANDTTRAAFPAAESIATAPGTPVTLPQLVEEPVQLQRLTDEQYRQYLHALQVAEEPAEPAAGTWQLAEAHE